ncbi:MAG: hypothetical protein ACFFCV_09000 [Promethearchaeota archaeon]
MKKKDRFANPAEERIRTERIAIYLDCIIGVFCSILSLSCIIFFAITEGIPYPGWFSFGLAFWILWLIYSLTLLHFGLKSKHLDEKKPRKDLKAPIV